MNDPPAGGSPPDDRDDERVGSPERGDSGTNDSTDRIDGAGTGSSEPVERIDIDDERDEHAGPTTHRDATTARRRGGGLDDLLPEASVDSRWWYWIAAVPVYFVITALAGVVAFFVAVFALGLDLLGLGGLATIGSFFLFAVGALLFAIPWLVLSVLFPIALYVDARAVSGAQIGWRPDPALYGLIGLASVLLTANTVSVFIAVYYLYRRHKAVGTP